MCGVRVGKVLRDDIAVQGTHTMQCKATSDHELISYDRFVEELTKLHQTAMKLCEFSYS